tara:strand:+ start:1605 stop:1943 length:339 start_codon:yes stop_codon:yes gene_type:complete
MTKKLIKVTVETPSHEEMNPINIRLNGNYDKWTDKEKTYAALNLVYILDTMGKAETPNHVGRLEGGIEVIELGKSTADQIKEARDIALEAVKKEREEAILDIERPVHNGMTH